MAEETPPVTAEILRTTVPVPGLPRPVRILHATDIHIGRPDPDSPPCTHEVRQRWKGELVEERVDRLFAAIEHEKFDALILTGDIVHYPTKSSVEWIRKRLDRVRAAIFYLAGNHDANYPSLPWDASIRDGYLPHLAPLFAPRKPGTMDRWDVGGLQFVSIDDSTYQVSPSQLAFAREAFSTGKPTVLLMHIPLSSPKLLERTIAKWKSPILLGEPVEAIAPGFLPQPPLPSTPEFVALVQGSRNVCAVLAGHVHFDHAENVTAETLQLVGPPGFDAKARMIDFVPG